MNSISGRLNKLYRHKSKWARKNKIDSFRLYDRDIPEFPFIVDIHCDYCVIYIRTNDKIDADKNHLPILQEAITEVCGIDNEKQILQYRKVQGEDFQYSKNNSEIELLTNERALKFKLLLNKYIDTGLFMDHRPLRKLLQESDLEGQKVLNLFCYTASLSVACAYSGAHVTSVDMSNTYLAWAKDNFKLNEINSSQHMFIREDVLKYLDNESIKSPNSMDMIILDPPTLSKSKKMDKTFDVQEDQGRLIERCMKILKPGGTLYFSNNLRSFKLNDKISQKYLVKDMTRWSIPQDFHDQKIHKLYKISLRQDD